MPSDSKTVIFLRRSDAPINVIDGVPVLWEQIGFRTYYTEATDPKVIEGIRARYIKANVGAVSEISEKELENQKKTAPQRTSQVHQPAAMHRDMSPEDPTQSHRLGTSAPAVAEAGSEKHSASSDEGRVENTPKVVRAGDLKSDPSKKKDRDAP